MDELLSRSILPIVSLKDVSAEQSWKIVAQGQADPAAVCQVPATEWQPLPQSFPVSDQSLCRALCLRLSEERAEHRAGHWVERIRVDVPRLHRVKIFV
jgi:hypothetical protein